MYIFLSLLVLYSPSVSVTRLTHLLPRFGLRYARINVRALGSEQKEKRGKKKEKILSSFVAVQSPCICMIRKNVETKARRRGDLPVHEHLREFANPPFPIGLQSAGFYVCDFARAAVITLTRYSNYFLSALSSRYMASRSFFLSASPTFVSYFLRYDIMRFYQGRGEESSL